MPLIVVYPKHNTTNVQEEVWLEGGGPLFERRDGTYHLSSYVLDSLAVINPAGVPLSIEELGAQADPPLPSARMPSRLVLSGVHDQPGWYTIRSTERDSRIAVHSTEWLDWLDVGDAYESDVLVGASQPGLKRVSWAYDEYGCADEELLRISLSYSESVVLDLPIAESVSVLDSEGNELSCESRRPGGGCDCVQVSDSEENGWLCERVPGEGEPVLENYVFVLNCDPTSPSPAAIRVDSPPRGETGVEAFFPPPGVVSYFGDWESREPEQEDRGHWWVRLRAVSEGWDTEETAHPLSPAAPDEASSIPPGGCGASVAGHGRPAVVAVMLLLSPLLALPRRRPGPRPPTRPRGCA